MPDMTGMNCPVKLVLVHGVHPMRRRIEFSTESLTRRVIAAREEHPGAFGDKPPGYRRTDRARGRENDRCLAAEQHPPANVDADVSDNG